MNSLSEILKENSHLRTAQDLHRETSGCPTGFSALDAALPGGGWPAGLIWANLAGPGIGELRLFLPAMRELAARQRRVIFLNPPYRPYASALAAAGVDLEYVRTITPERFEDSLWAADKLARSGVCGLVLFWREPGDRVTAMNLRRLQLAARQGGAHLVVYNRCRNPAHAEGLSAWASLALHLRAEDAASLTVRITRARGLHRPLQVRLSLPP